MCTQTEGREQLHCEPGASHRGSLGVQPSAADASTAPFVRSALARCACALVPGVGMGMVMSVNHYHMLLKFYLAQSRSTLRGLQSESLADYVT